MGNIVQYKEEQQDTQYSQLQSVIQMSTKIKQLHPTAPAN
jgi:hypothetical protein